MRLVNPGTDVTLETALGSMREKRVRDLTAEEFAKLIQVAFLHALTLHKDGHRSMRVSRGAVYESDPNAD